MSALPPKADIAERNRMSANRRTHNRWRRIRQVAERTLNITRWKVKSWAGPWGSLAMFAAIRRASSRVSECGFSRRSVAKARKRALAIRPRSSAESGRERWQKRQDPR